MIFTGCLTRSTMQSGWNSSPVRRLSNLFLSAKISNVDSSEKHTYKNFYFWKIWFYKQKVILTRKLTVFQSLIVLRRCSRAQASLFFFMASVNRGFLAGRWPVRPSSANLRCTVLFETVIPDSRAICVNTAALFFCFANRYPGFFYQTVQMWPVFCHSYLFFLAKVSDSGLYLF